MTIKLPEGFFTAKMPVLFYQPAFVRIPTSAVNRLPPEAFEGLKHTPEGFEFPSYGNPAFEQIRRTTEAMLWGGDFDYAWNILEEIQSLVSVLSSLEALFNEAFEDKENLVWGVAVLHKGSNYPSGSVPQDVQDWLEERDGDWFVPLRDLDLAQLSVLVGKFHEAPGSDPLGWYEVLKSEYVKRARAEAP